MMVAGTVDCRRCQHYYVTWDVRFPHGCRLIGFKSRLMPAWEVKKTSGRDCQGYAAKLSGEEVKT
ncbi:MAG: uracil-DNA glycosylase [Negativicutes bacterium]|nr:uracil-DNA glycosylase [Negativicutes bacterium]